MDVVLKVNIKIEKHVDRVNTGIMDDGTPVEEEQVSIDFADVTFTPFEKFKNVFKELTPDREYTVKELNDSGIMFKSFHSVALYPGIVGYISFWVYD